MSNCRYQTFGVADHAWTCYCTFCHGLDHGCMQSGCPGCVRDDASHQCNCEWTCRCHECRDDRDSRHYVFDKSSYSFAKLLWEKNNFIAEQQADLDRLPKKYARELAFFRDIYDEVHPVRDLELHQKEVDDIRAKLAESDKKLLESNQKLKIKESSLRDYREMITCKNEELDEYNKCVDGKNGEIEVFIDRVNLLKKGIDVSEKKCRRSCARVKSLEKTNLHLLGELAEALRSQEPDSKKQKLAGV
jgi:hypothetical protein